MRLKLLSAIGILCCVSAPAFATPFLNKERLAQEVGALFAAKGVDNTTPGCAVGIISNGEYIHMRGYGAANLEHRIAIGPIPIGIIDAAIDPTLRIIIIYPVSPPPIKCFRLDVFIIDTLAVGA